MSAVGRQLGKYRSTPAPIALVASGVTGVIVALCVGAALAVGVIALGAIQYGFSSSDSSTVSDGDMAGWVNPGIWISIVIAIVIGWIVSVRQFKNARPSAPRGAQTTYERVVALGLQLPRLPENPRDFELVTADWLLAWGCKGVGVTSASRDGGIDVYSDEILGQCKMRSSKKVGRPDIQNLLGSAHPYRGTRTLAFFAWSPGYSNEALKFADQNDIALFAFDGNTASFWSANNSAIRFGDWLTSSRSN